MVVKCDLMLVLVLLCVGALLRVNSKDLRSDNRCFSYIKGKSFGLKYLEIKYNEDQSQRDCDRKCSRTARCTGALFDHYKGAWEETSCILTSKPIISLTINSTLQACQDSCQQQTECKSLYFTYDNFCILYEAKLKSLSKWHRAYNFMDGEPGDMLSDKSC